MTNKEDTQRKVIEGLVEILATEITRHDKGKPQPHCDWKYDDIDDYYSTTCGRTFSFQAESVKENKYRFCPQCGRRIKLVC